MNNTWEKLEVLLELAGYELLYTSKDTLGHNVNTQKHYMNEDHSIVKNEINGEFVWVELYSNGVKVDIGDVGDTINGVIKELKLGS